MNKIFYNIRTFKHFGCFAVKLFQLKLVPVHINLYLKFNFLLIFFTISLVNLHSPGGLFGALFNQLNYKLTIFRNKYIHRPLARVAEAVLVAMISGTLSFLIILVYNDCQPMRAEPKNYPVQVRVTLAILEII